jgi:hypothetical protein
VPTRCSTLGVKEQEWQETTKGSVATLPGSSFVPDLVHEQPETKPSSPSFSSMYQVVVVGALPAEAVVATTMPTRCSTAGLDHPLQPSAPRKFGTTAPALCSTKCGHTKANVQLFIFDGKPTIVLNRMLGTSTDRDDMSEVLTNIEGNQCFHGYVKKELVLYNFGYPSCVEDDTKGNALEQVIHISMSNNFCSFIHFGCCFQYKK